MPQAGRDPGAGGNTDQRGSRGGSLVQGARGAYPRYMSLPDHLARAYRRSRYGVAGFALKVGRKSGALDGLLSGMGAREAVLITAWNPKSRRMPPQWNSRMMAALRDLLRSTPALPAWAGEGAWCEDHLLVIGDRRRLAVLARRFRQSAILGLKRGQDVRVVPLV